MSRIGILGGTFNPIHNGHILLGEYCCKSLSLDKIMLIPTYTPPHKSNKELVCEEHRLNMCNISTHNLNNFTVSDIEIQRKGKSYTYQTLTQLKESYPFDEFYLIMGADMFLTLHQWKCPEIIFEKATIVAVPRNEADMDILNSYYSDVIKKLGAKAVILEEPVLQVSSTYIRDNIENYNIIKPLLDKDVYEYIVENNLYRK